MEPADNSAESRSPQVSRRALLIGGLGVAATAGSVAAYLALDDDPPAKAPVAPSSPHAGSAPPLPRIRWSLHEGIEGWQAGQDTPAVSVSTDADGGGWLVGRGTGQVQLASYGDHDKTPMDWTLADRPNADRLTVSARVTSSQPTAMLQVTMVWDQDGSLTHADSVQFGVPTNLDIDVDTRWNCRGTAPDDVLRRVVGVRVTASVGGAMELRVRDVRQPPTTAAYGPAPHGVATMFTAAKSSGLPPAQPADEYAKRVLDRLDAANTWAADNHRAIHIGEWAWPKETSTQTSAKAIALDGWAGLAEQWMRRADELSIPFTPWGESAYWAGSGRGAGANYGSYPDASYYCGSTNYDRVGALPRVVDAMKPGAAPLQRHMNVVPGIKPSINVVGGCFVYLKDGTEYSSTNIGKRGSDYFVEHPDTIKYLYSKGWRVFRMPFRWDRVMRTPEDGQLDPDEWGYVRAGIERILALPDTVVIVDQHSSAQFWISPKPGDKHVPATKHVVDGPDGRLTTDNLVQFWTLVSDDLAEHSDRLIFEITNEPHGAGANAFTVRRYTQAVVTALREKGDTTFCLIPSFPFDNVAAAITEKNHPFPWIEDTAGSHRHAYTFHQYMDGEMSGRYAKTYREELAALR